MGTLQPALALSPSNSRLSLKPDSRMEFFMLLSLVATLVFAAPERQRHIRAAPGYENVCKLSEQAYGRAKSGGKSDKIAGVIAAKTFYVEFFNAKISGNVPGCKTKSKSVSDMVKYFNAANSNKMNVLTPICKASTLAYFNAKIEGKSAVEAKVAAAAAYMPFILKDLGADPGQACIKSQDYINN